MTIIYGTDRGVLTGVNRPNRLSALTSQGRSPFTTFTNPSYGFTAQNNAKTKTSIKKYGTASYFADGTGGNNHILHTSGAYDWWVEGTGPFTVECWLYIPTSTTGNYMEFCSNENTTGGFGFRLGQNYGAGNFNAVNVFRRGQQDMAYTSFTWTRDTWHHIAVVRDGTTPYIYIDGVSRALTGTGWGTTNFAVTTAINKIQIGNAGLGGLRNVYVDDFRVTKRAVYPGGTTFTPPGSFAKLVADTTLCMNMDGADNGTTFDNRTGPDEG